MGIESILVSFAFFVIGFVSGFFIRQGVGTLVFMLLIFSAFKILDLIGIKTNWADIKSLINAITMLGNSVYRIFTNFMSQGNAISISFFMAGLIMGFFFKGIYQRRKEGNGD